MNAIEVWLPLVCAGVGFAFGGLIGYGADKMRRRELSDDVRQALRGANALIDTCRELLDEKMFNKVRTRSMERLGMNGVM